MRTKTDDALAQALEEHADDPERAEAIRRTRRFKASWIELGEALSRLRRSDRWKAWGFESFEQYTRGELHLKPDTVEKLTGSFMFLKRRAPEVLDRDGLRAPIPSYAAVDFLRRAEEQEGAPKEAVDAIFKRVIDDGAPATAVAREYKDVVFPIDEHAKKERDAAALRNVATRLREILGETHAVPKKLAAEVAASLDRLLEAVGERRRDRAA